MSGTQLLFHSNHTGPLLKKQKTLQKCMNYIMEQAYQIAEKEHDLRFGRKKNPNRRADSAHQSIGMGMSETQVYQWAEAYYALEDEAEESKKRKAETKKRLNSLKKKEERKKNSISSGSSSAKGVSKEDTEKNAEKGEGNLEKESGTKGQDEGAKKSIEKPVQMSLFDMMAGKSEEKAGEE